METVQRARMEPIHYAEHKGEFCPYCRQAAVVGTGAEVASGRGKVAKLMRCSECNAYWQDLYLLVGYLPDKVPPDA